MPTTRASRLRAVRFSEKAAVSWAAGAGLLAGRSEPRPSGSRPLDPAGLVALEDQVDAERRPSRPKEALRRADVHDHQAVERALLFRVGGLDHPRIVREAKRSCTCTRRAARGEA